MPKVSIIVPVYNVEKFVLACLQSIRNQTFTDFECIIVDDKSTDSSPEICESFCRTDKRFKLYHHDINKGLAATRNTALDHAVGEYFAFADSDDVLHHQMIELLVTMLDSSGSNAAFIQLKEFVNDSEINDTDIDILQESERIRIYPKEEIFSDYVELTNCNHLFYGYMNTKMFHSEMFETLRFPENNRCYEDIYIMVDYLKESKSVVTLDIPMYFYRTNPDSLLRSDKGNPSKQYCFFLFQVHTADVLFSEGYIEESNKLMQFFVSFYLKYILDYYEEKKKQKAFTEFISQCRRLISNNKTVIKNNPLTTRMFRIALWMNQFSVRGAVEISKLLFR